MIAFPITWAPQAERTVNKRNLSTGENGEFDVEGAFGGQLTPLGNAALLVLKESRKNVIPSKYLG
jgi:hypothetical protein